MFHFDILTRKLKFYYFYFRNTNVESENKKLHFELLARSQKNKKINLELITQ